MWKMMIFRPSLLHTYRGYRPINWDYSNEPVIFGEGLGILQIPGDVSTYTSYRKFRSGFPFIPSSTTTYLINKRFVCFRLISTGTGCAILLINKSFLNLRVSLQKGRMEALIYSDFVRLSHFSFHLFAGCILVCYVSCCAGVIQISA